MLSLLENKIRTAAKHARKKNTKTRRMIPGIGRRGRKLGPSKHYLICRTSVEIK